jgi:hypothetical protein
MPNGKREAHICCKSQAGSSYPHANCKRKAHIRKPNGKREARIRMLNGKREAQYSRMQIASGKLIPACKLQAESSYPKSSDTREAHIRMPNGKRMCLDVSTNSKYLYCLVAWTGTVVFGIWNTKGCM